MARASKARHNVEVLGLAEVRRALQQLPDEVRRQVLDRAVEAAADEVLTEAQRRVPVGRTGKLKRALDKAKHHKFSDSKRAVWVIGPDPVVGASRRDGFYGLFVEKGTKDRTHKSGKSVGRTRATHWLRKSYRGAKKRALAAMAREIKSGISRVAPRVAGRL